MSFEARPSRAKIGRSSRSSSRFICIDTADWVLFTTSAALVKLPVSAMAMKVRNWSTSMSAVMDLILAGGLLALRLISPMLIGHIKNIRFTNQSPGAYSPRIPEESGGGFGWFRRVAGTDFGV